MLKLTAVLCLLILSACASSPESRAGFNCTHVKLVESTIAGNKMIQESCVRWERKEREVEQTPQGIHYRKLG